jgi:putative sugar O-methyltransferase
VSLNEKTVALLNSLLESADAKLVRKSALDAIQTKAALFSRMFGEETSGFLQPTHNLSPLPDGAASYLRPDNPRLRELKQKYECLNHPAADRSFWSEEFISREVNLQYFRGDNAYLWQRRDLNTSIHYLLATYYLQSIDVLRLLDKLDEDGLFGAYVYNFNDRLRVSRDLLDSIAEIYFLERNLGISNLQHVNILDIGAGYGRLAHRAVKALPNIGTYFCVDSVAESTFIAEYYLQFRQVNDRAAVIPLYEIEEALATKQIDVALNIHSFTECSASAVDAWLEVLRRQRVRFLVVIPNGESHGGTKLLSRERNDSRVDFLPLIQAKGYKMVIKEPKYLDLSVQRHGPSPTFHYLFELSL